MIAQFTRKISIASLVVGMLFLFSASAANATAKASAKLPKGMAYKASAKLPKGMKLKIIPVRAKVPIFEKDFKRCLSRAEKLELPAPPRDPLADCKGGVTVKAGASVVASCKPGFMGGRARSFIAINMKIKVRAFSQAIASGRAWAAARTEWSYRLRGWVSAEVSCVRPPKAPPAPPPPAYTPPPPSTPGTPVIVGCPVGWVMNAQLVCVQIVVECKAGEVHDSNGNCVVQTNTAEQDCRAKGGNWDSVKVTCTIIQVNGNCSNIIVINGDGNIINNWQEGNCNVRTPTCQERGDCPRPPCTDCDRGPQLSVVWPPHVYDRGGNQAIWSEASDPDGDALTTPSFEPVQGPGVTGVAHVSSTIVVRVRWDGTACPTGVVCYRSTLWGDSAGFVKFRATVTAGGKSFSTTSDLIEVKPDDFGANSLATVGV